MTLTDTPIAATLPGPRFISVDVLSAGHGWSIVRFSADDEADIAGGVIPGATVYAAAETASTVAVNALLGDRATAVTSVVASSSMTFLAAVPAGVTAHACLSEQASRIISRLDRDDCTAFAVIVAIRDQTGTEVARAEFEWRVTQPRSSERPVHVPAWSKEKAPR